MRAALLIGLAFASCKSVNPIEALVPGKAEDGPIEVRFEGNDSYSDGTLLEVIALDLADFEKSVLKEARYDESFIDDASFQIGLYYKSQGYRLVEESYTVEPRAERPLVTFRIQEGPRVRLTRIECTCATEEGEEPAFTEEEMRAFFEGPRTGALGRGELLFIEDNVNAAVKKARAAFLPRGFLDVQITPPTIEYSEDGTRAAVKMKISQGRRYLVGRVDFSSDSALPASVLEECRKRVDDARTKGGGTEKVYSPRDPYELRAVLGELLANAGYPDNFVDVTTEVDAAAARVHLEASLRPGVHVTVDEVRFEGNQTTGERFLRYLRSRVTFEQGDAYTNVALRESVSRLYETGLFASVDANLEESDAPTRDLVVKLEENPSLETFVEPGFGSYELFRLRLGIRERNWRDTGMQLRGDVTVGQRALRAQLGLRDPWFLHRDLIGDLTFSLDRRDEPSFSSGATGVGAFVTKRWTPRNWTTVGYQFRESTIGDVDVVKRELEEGALDDVDISSVRVTQRLDLRDHPFLPSRGSFLEVGLEQAGDVLGSEFKFTRFTGSASAYKTLRDGTVLASALRTGVIVPASDTVPLQERFYNGGENSVRSYRESELGPKDSEDNPIGGETYTTLSFELRQRLSPRWQLAGFVDLGNVSSDYTDYFDFEDVESGVGLGLRYLLPIGPLRLDLGVNPDPNKGEDDYVLQIAVGMAF